MMKGPRARSAGRNSRSAWRRGTCADAASYVAVVRVLASRNNEPAACEIRGTIQPVIVAACDARAGTITITWDTTVTCNYALNYVQTITVTPAPPPSFVTTPNDTTPACPDAASYVAAVTVLAHTNDERAACEISGTEQPVSVEAWDVCGCGFVCGGGAGAGVQE